MGALLSMRIYDRHAFDGYAMLDRRVLPGAPVKRPDKLGRCVPRSTHKKGSGDNRADAGEPSRYAANHGLACDPCLRFKPGCGLLGRRDEVIIDGSGQVQTERPAVL